MDLNKQTGMKCLCQEMPRDISAIGNVEDEVLFSFFLSKTKIKRLPFFFFFFYEHIFLLCVCGTNFGLQHIL